MQKLIHFFFNERLCFKVILKIGICKERYLKHVFVPVNRKSFYLDKKSTS